MTRGVPAGLLLAAVLGLASALTLSVSGCGSHALDLVRVREELVAGNLEAAAEEFERREGSDDDLLHLLERGHMLHLTGKWEASNQAFEAAEERADALYTRSISRSAASLATSDNILPYRGTDYELELVPYYRALNYLAQGEADGALVEARKANELLLRLAGDDEAKARGAGAEQQAFVHYVTGLIYAAFGETNDAVVSLRDAYRLYSRAAGDRPESLPAGLPVAYHDAASRLGLDEETRVLEKRHPELAARDPGAATDLVVFFETGFAPYREPIDIFLPIFEDDDDDRDDPWRRAPLYVDRYGSSIYSYTLRPRKLDRVLRFSFPILRDVPSVVGSCELELPDGRIVRAQPALDLEAVAHQTFEAALPGILLRTIARAITKEVARDQVEKKNELLGKVLNLVNVATEQADTRSWLLLPRRIALVETALPDDVGTVIARCRDRQGAVLDEWSLDLGPAAGATRFRVLRSFR